MDIAIDTFTKCCYKRFVKKGYSKKEAQERAQIIREKYESEIFFDENLSCDDEFTFDMEDELEKYSVNINAAIQNERILLLQRFYEEVEKRGNFLIFPKHERVKVDAEIDLPGEFGRTKLIDAALDGDLSSVMRLHKEGANLLKPDGNGHNAMQVAEIEGHEDIAEYLRKYIPVLFLPKK